jgi:hypothetical protein
MGVISWTMEIVGDDLIFLKYVFWIFSVQEFALGDRERAFQSHFSKFWTLVWSEGA